MEEVKKYLTIIRYDIGYHMLNHDALPSDQLGSKGAQEKLDYVFEPAMLDSQLQPKSPFQVPFNYDPQASDSSMKAHYLNRMYAALMNDANGRLKESLKADSGIAITASAYVRLTDPRRPNSRLMATLSQPAETPPQDPAKPPGIRCYRHDGKWIDVATMTLQKSVGQNHPMDWGSPGSEDASDHGYVFSLSAHFECPW